MTRITVTAAGYRFVAQTHPDAPFTVAAFTKLLPCRQKLIHVRWSGEGCWVPLGDFKLGVDFENHTSHPSVSDVLFYPGDYSETEIILAYGACSFSGKMGRLAGNHFLTILEGKENLRKLGTQVLRQGAQDILAAVAATMASTALPPSRSTSRPACAARWRGATSIPRRAVRV